MHHCDMRYSMVIASFSVTVACLCLLMASKDIFTEVGLMRRRAFRTPAAHSVPSASKRDTMSSAELAPPKHRSIAAEFASREAFAVSGTAPPAAAAMAAEAASMSEAFSPSARRPASTSASLSEGQKWVAMPARRQSAAYRRWPVSPRKVPMATPLERRGRAHVVPTSGKRPMPVSGIANMVFSVAMRIGLWMESPTPPPMTMPSQTATCKMPWRSRSMAIS
mmetsp:Transcript_91948/g.274366  ORF Transcript_91948/g.274366 Transcript_91948/m.274366 type:complete len:222 (+) Transcript_91948:254-919(+)